MKKAQQKRKIVYVTGTRADFGLMTPILKAIAASSKLDLQVYATGIHLMPKFGRTLKEVKEMFPSVKVIDAIFRTDDRSGMALFAGDFLTKLVAVLSKDKPDFVLTLGDRPEMLCVATACLYLGIPTGQVHGGEKTSTVDELARHAITKLSQVHFPATEESAERIRKMGEEDWRIHMVGAPSLDVILNEKLPSRAKLFSVLNLDPGKKIILVTQHPVSEEHEQAGRQMEETLAAVKSFGLPAVVIYPHADSGGRKIIEVIDREKNNPLFRIFPSLPYKQFLALEKECSVWVGNSSGAMVESSSFRVPVVNVGIRQNGRQRGNNVIDVDYSRKAIRLAIQRSLDDRAYLSRIAQVKSPWGDGKTGPRVAKLIEGLEINPRLLAKQVSY